MKFALFYWAATSIWWLWPVGAVLYLGGWGFPRFRWSGLAGAIGQSVDALSLQVITGLAGVLSMNVLRPTCWCSSRSCCLDPAGAD